VDVKIPASLKLGYIPAPATTSPPFSSKIGMNVTIIPAEKMPTENLSQYNTIVLGVRAYDAQKDVVANSQKLLDYVSNGGSWSSSTTTTLVPSTAAHFTPYSATLSRTRVSSKKLR